MTTLGGNETMSGSGYLALIAVALLGSNGSATPVACACGAAPAKLAAAPAGVKGVLREWRGTQSGVTERSQRVVRTQAEWERLWAQVRAPEVPAPPAPKIDWSREMALALFMGERSTGGYATAVQGVKVGEKEIVVTFEESSPPPDAITIQALTQPYHLVVVKRGDLPVRFAAAGKATVRPGE